MRCSRCGHPAKYRITAKDMGVQRGRRSPSGAPMDEKVCEGHYDAALDDAKRRNSHEVTLVDPTEMSGAVAVGDNAVQDALF